VALRAVVQGTSVNITRQVAPKGGASAASAVVGTQKAYMDGRACKATVYERAKLKAGNRIAGPAIVMEMDSTAVILPKHHGKVDAYGNILIYPDDYQAPRRAAASTSAASRPVAKRPAGAGVARRKQTAAAPRKKTLVSRLKRAVKKAVRKTR
jgi:hypothetical protein